MHGVIMLHWREEDADRLFPGYADHPESLGQELTLGKLGEHIYERYETLVAAQPAVVAGLDLGRWSKPDVFGDLPDSVREHRVRPAFQNAVRAGHVPGVRSRMLRFVALEATPEALAHIDRIRDAAERLASVYFKRTVVPADARTPRHPQETTGDLVPYQRYLADAPEGLGVLRAWQLPGGRGAGVTVIDVEQDWRRDHETLPEGTGQLVHPPADDTSSWPWPGKLARDHGTAVLGVLAGKGDGVGVQGVCPEANVLTAAFGDEQPGRHSHEAIAAAASVAHKRGDILLIEGQRADATGTLLPLEWWPCDRVALEGAIGAGWLVVAAAGNGGVSLDSYPAPADWATSDWARPGNPGIGSLMIGAGNPPATLFEAGGDVLVDLARAPMSNHGAAVVAQAYSEAITTSGYQDAWLGRLATQSYTRTFGATSGAAAIAAGALACLQGILRQRGELALTARGARNWLTAHGTPEATDSAVGSDGIGKRPDLRAMLAAEGIIPSGAGVLPVPVYGLREDRGSQHNHRLGLDFFDMARRADGTRWIGEEFWVYPEPVEGTVPLFHFRDCAEGDDSYDTALPDPLPPGRRLCGVIGYVFQDPPGDTLSDPITLYYSAAQQDHRTTAHHVSAGYAAVRVAGHAPSELARRVGVPAAAMVFDADCCGDVADTPPSHRATRSPAPGPDPVTPAAHIEQEEPAMSGGKAFSVTFEMGKTGFCAVEVRHLDCVPCDGQPAGKPLGGASSVQAQATAGMVAVRAFGNEDPNGEIAFIGAPTIIGGDQAFLWTRATSVDLAEHGHRTFVALTEKVFAAFAEAAAKGKTEQFASVQRAHAEGVPLKGLIRELAEAVVKLEELWGIDNAGADCAVPVAAPQKQLKAATGPQHDPGYYPVYHEAIVDPVGSLTVCCRKTGDPDVFTGVEFWRLDDGYKPGDPGLRASNKGGTPPHGSECGSESAPKGQTLWVVASGQKFKGSLCKGNILP